MTLVRYFKSNQVAGDLLSNGVRVVATQLFSLAVFYELAVSLTKDQFGKLNWCLSLLLISFTVLSFGIDQLAVKKIAEGGDAARVTSIYFFHALVAGACFYTLLLAGYVYLPKSDHSILILLSFGKIALFITSPFKQLANGLEKFRLLNVMMLTSLTVRSVGLSILFLTHGMSFGRALVLFMAGDLLESVVSYAAARFVLKIRLTPRFAWRQYFQLLRESLPQAGVVIFTASIARLDWVFLGIFAGDVAVAEYSFAYRIYEASSLPLLIIAPLLIPRFTKILHRQQEGSLRLKEQIETFLDAETWLCSCTAFFLNAFWHPLINWITDGRYGTSGQLLVFILSFSLPLLYLNNLLWTVAFVKNCYRSIFLAFLITFVLVAGLDIALIPLLQGNGAAVAYLIALGGQFLFFLLFSGTFPVYRALKTLAISFVASLLGGLAGHLHFEGMVSVLFPGALAVILLFTGKTFVRKIMQREKPDLVRKEATST